LNSLDDGQKLGGDRGNLPAVVKEGAKASVTAQIAKANNRASDLIPIIEELKAAGVPCRFSGCWSERMHDEHG
jgi:hypothetical protein